MAREVMPIEVVRRIDELGRQGMTQTAIAEALGINKDTLRSRLERMGLMMTPATRVVDTRTREPLESLLERGEIVAEEREEVAA